MFNPQDQPTPVGWEFDAGSPRREDTTPFMAQDAPQEEKMVNSDDYEKIKAQKEFAVKQTVDQQKEIEKLKAEMEELKAKQEAMLNAMMLNQQNA